MSDRYFLDTNILVYTFDAGVPRKKEIARRLVEDALQTGQGVISYQVVQEFINVASRKFETPMGTGDLLRYLDQVLSPLCEAFGSIELFGRGIYLSDRYGYSFFDSLIIAAALETGCTRIYSEDLRHGQIIENAQILNPFES